MRHFLVLLICLPLLTVLGGCSVFGVATKSDLDDLASQEAASTRASQQRLEALEDRLVGISDDVRALDPRLLEMETDVDRIDADIAQAKQRLLDIDVGLRSEVGKIRGDMDWIKQAATLASEHSNRALKVQYESLLQERDRLGTRLAVLDTLILQWRRDFERIQNARPDSAAGAAEIDTSEIDNLEVDNPEIDSLEIDNPEIVPEQSEPAADGSSRPPASTNPALR